MVIRPHVDSVTSLELLGGSFSGDQLDFSLLDPETKAAFGVFSEKAGDVESEFYLVNHTALTFLIDKDGSFEGTIAYEEASDTALAKIDRLVKG